MGGWVISWPLGNSTEVSSLVSFPIFEITTEGFLPLKKNRLNSPAPAESPEFHRWQKLFGELADLLGLTLAVYNGDEFLLGTSRPNMICEAIQLREEGLCLCEQDCGAMLAKAAQGGGLATFKCHAHLYNFAVPIYVKDNVQFVLLGGRVFRNYQDFTNFTKVAPRYAIKDYSFLDWENSLRFQNADQFRQAARFVQAVVDSLSQDTLQVDSFKKKSYQLTTLYELSSMLPLDSSSEKIYQVILQALAVLFDAKGGAVLENIEDKDGYRIGSSLGTSVHPGHELDATDSLCFEQLKKGLYLFTDETYQILKMGYPDTIHSIHSFPIFYRNHLAWVIQVYNTPLDQETVQMITAFCRHIAISLENISLRQEVRKHSKVLSVVTDFGVAINSKLDSQDLYQAILFKTLEVLQAEQGSLMIFEDASEELSIKCIKGINSKLVERLRLTPGEGISGIAFEAGKPLLVKDIESDPRFPSNRRARYRTKSCMSIPLAINERKIGVLNIADKVSGEAFDENDLNLLVSIASHASVALDRAESYQRSEDLRKISITDPLTELFNRRFFQNRLIDEIERGKRHNQPLSLIMLDIDNFKEYNDTYGHLAGDEALKITAGVIRGSIRNIDMVARYGGEEFAVILPMTEAYAARDIAERIRSGVASRYYPDEAHRMDVRLSVSLGIASFPEDADNLLNLVGNADKALYLAKVSGKNRVSIFDKVRIHKSASGF